jgi:hypothetical protein
VLMSAEPSPLIVKVWSNGLVIYSSPRRLQVPWAASLAASNIKMAICERKVGLRNSKRKPVSLNVRQAFPAPHTARLVFTGGNA